MFSPNKLQCAGNVSPELSNTRGKGRRSISKFVFSAFAVGVIGLSACHDATAPAEAPIDQQAITESKPGVSDSRDRLVAGINSGVVGQQVSDELAILETAMAAGAGSTAQYEINKISSVLSSYLQTSDGSDGPDISAIFLSLDALTRSLVCNGVQGVSADEEVDCSVYICGPNGAIVDATTNSSAQNDIDRCPKTP